MSEECDSNMRLKWNLSSSVDFLNGIMDQIIVGIFKRMNDIHLVLDFSKSKKSVYKWGFF